MDRAAKLARQPEASAATVAGFRAWLRRTANEPLSDRIGCEAEHAFALGQIDRELEDGLASDLAVHVLMSLLGRLDRWQDVAREYPLDPRARAFTAAARELRLRLHATE